MNKVVANAAEAIQGIKDGMTLTTRTLTLLTPTAMPSSEATQTKPTLLFIPDISGIAHDHMEKGVERRNTQF